MTVSDYFQSIATARDRPRYVGMVVLKFLLSFIAGSAIYALAVAVPTALTDVSLPNLGVISEVAKTVTVEGVIEFVEDVSEFIWEGRWLLLAVTAPALPAGLVYVELPEHTVDRYHKLGKYFVQFITINFTLSAIFMADQFHFTAHPVELTIPNVILYFSIASVFLPGPYIGTYIAVRWMDD